MNDARRFPSARAPEAPRRPATDSHHGVPRSDDYGWLRASNWQDVLKDPTALDPDIRAHLERENAYQDELMKNTQELRAALYAEMKGRIKDDDASVPMDDGPYAYGTAFQAGGQHARYVRTPRGGGEVAVILDGDAEAEGRAYFRLAGVEHAPDHRRLVWGYDDTGSEFHTLRVRDIASGDDLPDRVEDTGGGGTWDAGGDGFFYTLLDANHRPSQVRYHRLGTDSSADRLVYEEDDHGFFLGVGGSRRRDWIFLSIHDHETTEYRILPAGRPDLEPTVVVPRETGLQYDLEEGGDVFFVLTNADGAKDFKIMEVPVDTPGREHWRPVVAHEPGRLILSILGFRDFLVRLERLNGLPRLVVRERRTGEEHVIAFEEEAYSIGLSGSLEYDTDTLRFSYSSMTTPAQVFDYDMRTRHRVLLKTQEIPSGHDSSRYVTRRLMAPAADGETVPISLLHRADLVLDGSAPCLLYGYGAYGITIPAGFGGNVLSLVDRGFVFAIAHVRGGKDKGYGWYEDGKRARKMNSFTDFIAATDHLVALRYTAHPRIVGQGGSAGGLLVGAAVNLAPEKFGAIVAEVPFVDVLATMLDASLPLTPPEWPEWGNPIASADDHAVIAAYSPYDNVAARPYPPVLALAGLTDPRVTYWEAAKWVARLRRYTTSGEPVLLRVNMEAGHGGASGRYARLEEVAYVYAFALRAMGM